MLAKRIIPCLDVLNNQVVKGVRFQNHRVIGDILSLAKRYSYEGADELVFYDIGASANATKLSVDTIGKIAKHINIPFCVAGGIDSVDKARAILNAGADKVSINSPAIANPDLIDQLVAEFGQQCIVIGIDSKQIENQFVVCQYTGNSKSARQTIKDPLQWAKEVENRGVGEIVLNCMNQDGVKRGYDIKQLEKIARQLSIPVIASGGAGKMSHFYEVFTKTNVSGALAASVFHDEIIAIDRLKSYLNDKAIHMRI